jgi:hypothetical protein
MAKKRRPLKGQARAKDRFPPGHIVTPENIWPTEGPFSKEDEELRADWGCKMTPRYDRLCAWLIALRDGDTLRAAYDPKECEQEVVIAIQEAGLNMSADHWTALDHTERGPWLEKAITFFEAQAKQRDKRERTTNPVEALLENADARILEIAARKDDSADDRALAICDIDRRCWVWKSPRWAKLLGVSDAAIRKGKFWKEAQKYRKMPRED